MALSISQLFESIRAEKNKRTEISGIKFDTEGGSAVGKANTWASIFAIVGYFVSALFDRFISDSEAIVLGSVAGTNRWIRKKIMEFQYGDTIVLDEDTLSVNYETIDETKRIVTGCAVITTSSGAIQIKVCKGGTTPVALTTTELNALKGYYGYLATAGVQYTITTANSDKLFIEGTVYYDGQLVETISADVKLALQTYLSSLEFNGIVYLSDIERIIRSVTGVKDVVIKGIYARADSTLFASASKLIDNYTLTAVTARRWATVSGYMELETESGQTFDDKMTFEVQN